MTRRALRYGAEVVATATELVATVALTTALVAWSERRRAKRDRAAAEGDYVRRALEVYDRG